MYDSLDTTVTRQHTIMVDPTLSIVLPIYFLAHEEIDMRVAGGGWRLSWSLKCRSFSLGIKDSFFFAAGSSDFCHRLNVC